MSSWPVASALLAIISDTVQPAPKRSASRRIGASVIPAMGARKARLGSSCPPTLILRANSLTNCTRNGQFGEVPAQ